jgi:hypothetical protein
MFLLGGFVASLLAEAMKAVVWGVVIAFIVRRMTDR